MEEYESGDDSRELMSGDVFLSVVVRSCIESYSATEQICVPCSRELLLWGYGTIYYLGST